VTDAQAHAEPVSRRSGVVRIIGLDLIAPLVVYRFCRGIGVSEVWSLAVAATPPGAGVAVGWLRRRTLDVTGAIVLGGIGLSILLAALSNESKVILLKGAALTGAFGLACLVSLVTRRPLIFYFAQAFYGGRHSVEGARLDAGYDLYREGRFYWRTVTVVWGVAYLVEAAVLLVVVESTTTGAALSFSRTLPWLVFGLLFGWTFWWGARVADQDAEGDDAPEVGSAGDGQEDHRSSS
jgi:intracellular septation protein A